MQILAAPYLRLCWLNASEQISCFHVPKPAFTPRQSFSPPKKQSPVHCKAVIHTPWSVNKVLSVTYLWIDTICGKLNLQNGSES